MAECTLADAIYEASVHPGADRIHFAIPGAGPHVIALDWVLDVESDLIIDGYTQPGATPNTNATGGLNGSLQIVLVAEPERGPRVPRAGYHRQQRDRARPRLLGLSNSAPPSPPSLVAAWA